jgi:F-type H+-transporting ATPase subunit b
MHEIFQKLADLYIGSIPTIVLFIAMVVAYEFLVQKPLQATLKERRARTTGAVDDAHKAIEKAEARAAEYAARLRRARTEVFKAREARLQQWNAEREAALDAARKAAGKKVGEAKSDIDAETVQARRGIEGSAGELASQVARAVLPAAAGSSR